MTRDDEFKTLAEKRELLDRKKAEADKALRDAESVRDTIKSEIESCNFELQKYVGRNLSRKHAIANYRLVSVVLTQFKGMPDSVSITVEDITN